MKNKNLVVKLLISAGIVFILLTLFGFLFNEFDILNDTVWGILRKSIIIAILWFFFMFFWIKRKMKKQNQ
jgi:hypothetical protein